MNVVGISIYRYPGWAILILAGLAGMRV